MFPRNIRRIEPWKISQIASLIQAAMGEVGNQALQDDLYAQLSKLGVKREKQNDGTGVSDPGGFRTYLAQLACLGLFYVSKDKTYVPTYAGEVLIQGKNPVGVLRCQLLRLQYPSVYGWGHNVQIDPAMRVKPFAFIIRLLRDSRIGGFLTCREVAVCVIYGRTRGDLEKCVDKILTLRADPLKDLVDVVDTLEDLCTPKRWNKPDDVLWDRGLTDAGQIANTALNYMIAVGFVEAEKGIAGGDTVYRLTTDEKALADIDRWMPEEAKLENVPNDPGMWINAQNRFGRYDKDKVVSIGQKKRTFGFSALIKASYISEVERSTYGFDHAAFVKAKAAQWQKSETEIEECVTDLRKRITDISRTALINAANSGGSDAIQLEVGITNVFRSLGFDLSEHIGQKRATVKRRGGFPDVYIRSSTVPGSAMADTKATSKYNFPLGDTQKLGSYYRDAWKEIDPTSPSCFFLYIAGSFAKSHTSIKNTLDDCTQDYGAPVSAVTVYALLDLAGNGDRPSASELMKVFSSPRFFNSDMQIIQAARNL